MMRSLASAVVLPAFLFASPASADEAFAGVYVHEVNTPFTLNTGEGGADFELGYRFGGIEALKAIGRPALYLLASINSQGDTSFAGAGLSWKLGKGRVYVRPGIGLVVHDGPRLRASPNGTRTDLGSRVLFEPELAIGTRVSDRVSIEASWVHISHARLFNSRQNPGLDMMGARLVLGLR